MKVLVPDGHYVDIGEVTSLRFLSVKEPAWDPLQRWRRLVILAAKREFFTNDKDFEHAFKEGAD